MNIFLFEKKAICIYLPIEDVRVRHIKEILKMGVGSEFCVGIINGTRGKAKIVRDDEDGLLLEVDWELNIPELLPITLIVGITRPQTAREILEKCTSMGVESLIFFGSEKGEPSYASSKLWKTDEWKRHLIKGAEQAFCTRLPEVLHFKNLRDCLVFLDEEKGSFRVALDNYEANDSLTSILEESISYMIAVGAERGWSGKERNLLCDRGFKLAHLGDRVLRVETACIAGISLVLSKLGKF